MKPKFLRAVGFLCLMPILLATSCERAITADHATVLTLKTFESANAVESIFEKYSNVYVESTFYQPSPDGGKWEAYEETLTFIKGDKGISLYSTWYDGSENAFLPDVGYHKYPNGEYGVYACIDGGYDEQLYFPATSKLIYMPLKNQRLISNTEENGVRKLVVQADVEESYAEYIGLTQGVVETVYELDLESNLLLRASEYILDGGEKQVIAEGRILYGEDDTFIEPEYVRLCRDMRETRTVHFVLDAGTANEKTHTFTLSRKARIIPQTDSEYELFEDPAYTLPYIAPPVEEYPDEKTIYIKKL